MNKFQQKNRYWSFYCGASETRTNIVIIIFLSYFLWLIHGFYQVILLNCSQAAFRRIKRFRKCVKKTYSSRWHDTHPTRYFFFFLITDDRDLFREMSFLAWFTLSIELQELIVQSSTYKLFRVKSLARSSTKMQIGGRKIVSDKLGKDICRIYFFFHFLGIEKRCKNKIIMCACPCTVYLPFYKKFLWISIVQWRDY